MMRTARDAKQLQPLTHPLQILCFFAFCGYSDPLIKQPQEAQEAQKGSRF